MIFVGLGSNLPGRRYNTPQEVCEAALAVFPEHGLTVTRRSGWYASAPVPPSDQPWFINGLAIVESAVPGRSLSPEALLDRLHDIEACFGRLRSGRRNEARILDLDIIDYEGMVRPAPAKPELPHPRLSERSFGILPLAELAPGWRHPVTGRGVQELIDALPAGFQCRAIEQ